MAIKQGDIVSINFSPTQGHEQSGYRLALIISNNDYSKIMGLHVVCPITSNTKVFPSHVLLDSRTKTNGAILCEHIRTVDLSARPHKKLESCPKDILEKTIKIVKSIF